MTKAVEKASGGQKISDERWDELMDEFEMWVAEGNASMAYWQQPGKPHFKTFYKKARNDPEFAKRYRRALTFRAIGRIEEVEEMTAMLVKGYAPVYDPDTGEPVGVEKMDMVATRRLETAIRSHQWLAERENRAVFNPKNPDVDPLETENKLSERLNASKNRDRLQEKKR
jgi:hypothetical protein